MQALSSFGDTASHLPDCCSLHALVSDAEGPYLNRLSQRKSLIPSRPRHFALKASHLSTSDPERELTPCSRQATKGTQIRCRRQRHILYLFARRNCKICSCWPKTMRRARFALVSFACEQEQKEKSGHSPLPCLPLLLLLFSCPPACGSFSSSAFSQCFASFFLS